jgi:hypothetical protein
MRNVLSEISIENQNTNFMFTEIFFLKNHTAYEIIWENIVQPIRPQLTI